MIDTGFIGRLPQEHLAALSIGTTLMNSFAWIFNFLIYATSESIASRSDDSKAWPNR